MFEKFKNVVKIVIVHLLLPTLFGKRDMSDINHWRVIIFYLNIDYLSEQNLEINLIILNKTTIFETKYLTVTSHIHVMDSHMKYIWKCYFIYEWHLIRLWNIEDVTCPHSSHNSSERSLFHPEADIFEHLWVIFTPLESSSFNNNWIHFLRIVIYSLRIQLWNSRCKTS